MWRKLKKNNFYLFFPEPEIARNLTSCQVWWVIIVKHIAGKLSSILYPLNDVNNDVSYVAPSAKEKLNFTILLSVVQFSFPRKKIQCVCFLGFIPFCIDFRNDNS